MKRLLLCSLLLVTLAGCTVRGGWPRFLRPGESWGWHGTTKPSVPALTATNGAQADRPWLEKTPEAVQTPPIPPMPVMASRASILSIPVAHTNLPTKGVFGAYLEATEIVGLNVQFEGKTNLLGTNWMILTNLPYPMAGGTLYYTNSFTNFPALYCRECYVWPHPSPLAYSSRVP